MKLYYIELANSLKFQVISGAGHHVYADKPELFNQIVAETCNIADGVNSRAIMPPSSNQEQSEEPESDRSITPPPRSRQIIYCQNDFK